MQTRGASLFHHVYSLENTKQATGTKEQQGRYSPKGGQLGIEATCGS